MNLKGYPIMPRPARAAPLKPAGVNRKPSGPRPQVTPGGRIVGYNGPCPMRQYVPNIPATAAPPSRKTMGELGPLPECKPRPQGIRQIKEGNRSCEVRPAIPQIGDFHPTLPDLKVIKITAHPRASFLHDEWDLKIGYAIDGLSGDGVTCIREMAISNDAYRRWQEESNAEANDGPIYLAKLSRAINSLIHLMHDFGEPDYVEAGHEACNELIGGTDFAQCMGVRVQRNKSLMPHELAFRRASA